MMLSTEAFLKIKTFIDILGLQRSTATDKDISERVKFTQVHSENEMRQRLAEEKNTRHSRGCAFQGAGAFVGRKNSHCLINLVSFLLKQTISCCLIDDRCFSIPLGEACRTETSVGRADRLKRTARSGGWFSVRPTEKRSPAGFTYRLLFKKD
ncbi:hypothetical protein BTO30_09825 [Domibacillus antri]|uniref:Uncharacterized protein n=1 Tax=Domibacillus antri TaxID=1714264 RepID=A0A1Q8Q4Y4_9BACI|nr:hypothetical protein BTO30_09825 [Domibacillus antri]